MTLDDLRIFVAVCEHRSLSAVARAHGCTQPAISQHISRLERELAIELLERSPTGVQPTEAGRELRAAAGECLSALDIGVSRVRELSGQQTRQLTVTTGGTSVRHFLKSTVIAFRRMQPQINLTFLPANSTERCLELLRDGRAELALVTVRNAQRGIEHRVYAQQDLRLLVPNDDALAKRKQVDLHTLDDQRLIDLSERTVSHGVIEKSLLHERVTPRSSITVDDFDTACVFVEVGLGYAIVPAVQAFNFSKSFDVTALKIVGSEHLPIGLACRRWKTLSSPAQAFVEEFCRELRDMAKIPGVEVFREYRR